MQPEPLGPAHKMRAEPLAQPNALESGGGLPAGQFRLASSPPDGELVGRRASRRVRFASAGDEQSSCAQLSFGCRRAKWKSEFQSEQQQQQARVADGQIGRQAASKRRASGGTGEPVGERASERASRCWAEL